MKRWWIGVAVVGALGCGGGETTAEDGGRGSAGAPGGPVISTGVAGQRGAGGAAGQRGTAGSPGGADEPADITGVGGDAGATDAAGTGGAAATGEASCTKYTIPACTTVPSPNASGGWFVEGSWHGYATGFSSGQGDYNVAPFSFHWSGDRLCMAGSLDASA